MAKGNPILSAAAAAAVLAALCGAAGAATYVVDSNHPKAGDQNAGSGEAPFKTIAKGLAAATAGDTVLVKAGAYPETVGIFKSGEPNKPIVLRGEPKHAAVVLGGLDANGAAFVRVEDLRFAPSDAMKGRKVFVNLRGLADFEFVGCDIGEKAENSDWVYRGIDVYSCRRTVLRDCRIHHVDLGVNLGACKDCVVEDTAIGPWDHEDGLRMMRCDGILVQNCEIQSEETYRPDSNHPRSGHIDGIQIIRKNDNITIRNCYIHGTAQGIGVFTDSFGTVEGWNEPRKNLRIEGCIILTKNKYQGISLWRVDDPVVVNNTLPVSRIDLGTVRGGVVKNNVAAIGGVSQNVAEADYNIWFDEFKSGSKTGKNDLLVGTNPQFVDPNGGDYRLKPSSPAIDSADSTVGRSKDRAGSEAFDAPGAENKGAGPKSYLDRGALEYVPEKAAQPPAATQPVKN
jgi:polygalacturonase